MRFDRATSTSMPASLQSGGTMSGDGRRTRRAIRCAGCRSTPTRSGCSASIRPSARKPCTDRRAAHPINLLILGRTGPMPAARPELNEPPVQAARRQSRRRRALAHAAPLCRDRAAHRWRRPPHSRRPPRPRRRQRHAAPLRSLGQPRRPTPHLSSAHSSRMVRRHRRAEPLAAMGSGPLAIITSSSPSLTVDQSS